MADDKKKSGKQDRAKIATKQPYEMRTARKATGASLKELVKAVEKVGHGREAVYKALSKKK